MTMLLSFGCLFFVSGWWFVCDGELCCLCLVLRVVWVYKWCISSQVCIVAVVFVCMKPVCVVSVVTSD